ncbi:MAG: CbiX/SirB N-terminal domain-containing protein [Pseudomonadota bacterium]
MHAAEKPPVVPHNAPAAPPAHGAAGRTAGLILLAHGARDAAWAAPFERVAAAVRAARPGLAVALAYLEFMAPDLPSAGAALAQAGCRHVTVLPLFLGVGGHVRKDLPVLLERLRAQHPGVRWTLAPTIGEDARLVAAIAAIALDAADAEYDVRL